MKRLGEIVSERAAQAIVGRNAELQRLGALLDDQGPLVAHVHGVAGVGKSTLLELFAQQARANGARVVRIDCRAIAPTPRALLEDLGAALGDALSTVEDAARKLTSFGDRVVLVLDTYEVFVLLDIWMRQSLVPALPANARVLLAGRNPPSPAWRTAPGWQGLFMSVGLEPLAERDALEWLERSGVTAGAARRIFRLTRGHPLALGMAASLAQSSPGQEMRESSLHEVVAQLARSYVESVPDTATRRVLETCSVVRCVTEPLLAALLPGMSPRDALERLEVLPFVEPGREGLFIHDAVRSAIASGFERRDPDAYGESRRAAWTFLRDKIQAGGLRELWRHVADLLFLVENPVLREGFFPSGPHPLALEPATAADEGEVKGIISAHAPAELSALSAWWKHHPEAFRIARDAEGTVRGFYVIARAESVGEQVASADPVAAAWLADARRRGLESCVFKRRWLDKDVGEAPSAVQAASSIDLKRTYLEMAKLRFITMCLSNPQPYGEVAAQLGFVPSADPVLAVGGSNLYGFTLDLGAGAFLQFLTELVGRGVSAGRAAQKSVLDIDARELVLPSGRVGLTSLEFGVMRYLQERPGRAVSRWDLMEAVWGHRTPTASNVVDVVVRSLRQKLGSAAGAVETVRGTGYRFRPGAQGRS